MAEWKVTYHTEQSSYRAVASGVFIIEADSEEEALAVALDHHYRRYGRDNFYRARAERYTKPAGRVLTNNYGLQP